jgi:peptidyl-prolyl cis-trans isomerase SurA
MPVRTQYGYHIVKLNKKRPAQGEIHVAHILLKFSEKATDDEKARVKTRIDSIYKELANGKLKWDDAVPALSEDRTSKNKKGELQWFGVGRMMPEFEEAAYALQKDGDISKPIKTNYGWHIIKRLEKRNLPPFSEVKADFKKKVERDSRSSVAKTKLIERIKKENQFSESSSATESIFEAVDSYRYAVATFTPILSRGSLLNRYSISQVRHMALRTLVRFLEKSAKRRNDKGKDGLLNEYYENWVNQRCLDYEESMLEQEEA